MGATRPAGKMQGSYTISKGSQTARITLMSVSLCHKNPDARRVAPISACVWCLRLVVAFFADFVNASPYQLTQLTDFQYALCDGAKNVTKSGNEQRFVCLIYIKIQLQTIIQGFTEQTIIRS